MDQFPKMIALAGVVAAFFLLPSFATDTSLKRAQDRSSTPSYLDDVQPVFNKRCIACHGCLGSPCNLKLTSFRAAERGAH